MAKATLALGGCGPWFKEEWMESVEKRGSGAMRVDNGHKLTNCSRIGMFLGDACIEVGAPSEAEIQASFAAAMSTKEILINKQKKRQFRSEKVHALLG